MNLIKGASLPIPQQQAEDEFYYSIVADQNYGFWLGIQKTENLWTTDSGSELSYGIFGDQILPWNGGNSFAENKQMTHASSFQSKWYPETQPAQKPHLNVICVYVCRLYNIY